MEMAERVIRGGLLVDGSGAPPRRADVAIGGGRVVGVKSHINSQGAEVVVADGLVVMPGIVDTHTHYDPQLTFDPYATSACFHGVTSVVTGLCGFSIAPCRPADRDFLTGFFAAVEGMSRSVLDTALEWSWEGFDQFLAGLQGRLGVNMAMYVGHSSIRRYIMGEAASQREATHDEIAAMSSMVRDAVRVGAAGFASAQLAAEAKLTKGSIAYLPASAVDGIDQRDKDFLLRLAAVSGHPVIIQGIGWRPGMDEMWQNDQAFFDRAAQSRAKVYSSYRTQPYTRPFTWAQGTSLYGGVFHWRYLTKMPAHDRLQVLADPDQRAELRWAFDNPNTDGSKGSNLPPPPPSRTFVERSPTAPGSVGRCLSLDPPFLCAGGCWLVPVGGWWGFGVAGLVGGVGGWVGRGLGGGGCWFAGVGGFGALGAGGGPRRSGGVWGFSRVGGGRGCWWVRCGGWSPGAIGRGGAGWCGRRG